MVVLLPGEWAYWVSEQDLEEGGDYDALVYLIRAMLHR